MWLSCFRSRKAKTGETQPLLSHHEDDTALQSQLHEKLRSYQMIKALSSGYMPSTDQIIAHLRGLLVSDLFNPPNDFSVGNTSRQLTRDCKLCIRLLIELLREKNGGDQLQDAIWKLSNSGVSLDTAHLASRASQSKAHADTAAARESIRTFTSLLLTNADFRRLIDDLATIGRVIFADTASSLSETAAKAAKKAEPSAEEITNLETNDSQSNGAPTTEHLQGEVEHAASIAREGIADTGKAAIRSAEENVFGNYKSNLLYRLKRTVQDLRKQDGYDTSVSTIACLIKRYAAIYSRSVETTIAAAEDDVEVNDELREGVRNLWTFLGSFGDRNEWALLESKFHDMVKHSEKDPEFETLLMEIGNSIQSLLTDPEFFDSASERMDDLKNKSSEISSESPLRQDINACLQQLNRAINTVPKDENVAKLLTATKKLGGDLSNAFHKKAPRVSEDALNVFLPILIRSIQHIPIPRLEISVPQMDLLLENVVLEPGHTFHASSFLPHRVLVTTRNDIEVCKAHSKAATTSVKNVVTITINGLNVSANEFGYWIRTHAPFLPYFGDEGIASFALDQRGIDISLDIEIGRDRIERMISLLAVRVHIHKLDYTIHKGTWSFMWWVLKPFLKHMVRRVLEKKIAEQIVAAAHVLNRELVFARERLRATRIAGPQNLATFARAVLTRVTPKMHSDFYVRVGMDAHRHGVFKDVYAPGSLMKVWKEQGEGAQEAVESGDQSGGAHMTWRNDIFDHVPSRASTSSC
ncbi:hypothetical protein FQN50_002241 [Emmonsiellopsis sp. PD_5]|nr:hypothetical protein FQN50_002241 [Emmonsiellopsis sp. PD_5]